MIKDLNRVRRHFNIGIVDDSFAPTVIDLCGTTPYVFDEKISELERDCRYPVSNLIIFVDNPVHVLTLESYFDFEII